VLGKIVMRIVVDTNIWISFLIGKQLKKFIDIIFSGDNQIYFSNESWNELAEVLRRPKLAKYFPIESVDELLLILSEKVCFCHPHKEFDNCRDPKDNFLLNLVYCCKADYLITGDKDLLILNPFENTKIISPQSFETEVMS